MAPRQTAGRTAGPPRAAVRPRVPRGEAKSHEPSESKRQCYHCKEWIDNDAPHDCWTTTEAALTAELSDDLRDAWERLREAAAELGEQRIYASHHCIMFSRKACYFFVRPKRNALELCVFLGRTLKSPLVRRATPSSKTKIAHLIDVKHRDQVEPPLTDWIREAYELPDALSLRKTGASPSPVKVKSKARPARAGARRQREK